MLALSLLCAVLLNYRSAMWVYGDDELPVSEAVEALHGVETASESADAESQMICADGSDRILPVESGKAITVIADGKSTVVELYSGTVRVALDKAGIVLGEDDECFPATEVLLRNGMTVSVSRVSYAETVTTEPVPYKTERKNDGTLEKGKTRVQQKGKVGVRTVVTRVEYTDGEITSQTVVRDEVTVEPVTEIIAVGTKAVYGPYHDIRVKVQTQNAAVDLDVQAEQVGTGNVPGSSAWRARVNSDGTITDQYGNTVTYQNVISGRATAYYAKEGAYTSTGRKAAYGVVAVDPKVIPYGTKLFICSADGSRVYGYAVAGDTGGTLLKGTVLVDLYYNNYNQCVWFGSKKMNVYILG